jgi:hypothetical protein
MAPSCSQSIRKITESQKQRENRAIAAAKSNPPTKSILCRVTPPSDEELSVEEEIEDETPLPKPKQKVSIDDWTYQLLIVAYCGKRCVYSKVKPQKISQVNIRLYERDLATQVRHEMLKDKGNTQWTRDCATASLYGSGMLKVDIFVSDSVEWWDVEENLKDYWEKDIKKVRVEYKVKFVAQVPENDSDIEEIESLTASHGKGKQDLTHSPTSSKKRKVVSFVVYGVTN